MKQLLEGNDLYYKCNGINTYMWNLKKNWYRDLIYRAEIENKCLDLKRGIHPLFFGFPSHFRMCVCSVTQSCLIFCHPMGCSLPGSSVHRIFQTGILEQVAVSYSKGSSQSRDQTRISCISCIAGRFFTIEPPEKPLPSSRSAQSTVVFPLLYSRFSLAVYFIRRVNNVYMSIPISQFIPPLLPCLVSIHLFSISALCWERLRTRGEGGGQGWDSQISLAQWT